MSNLVNFAETIDYLKQQLGKKISDQNKVLEPKQVENETLVADLEGENKFLKNEIMMVKTALNTAAEENITLLDSLNKSESKTLELEKSIERADARIKTSLKDFATKIQNQRSSYELNLKELKEFKKLKVAEDKKNAKLEKKAKKKARKIEIKALYKAIDRITSKDDKVLASEKAGIKEMFSGEDKVKASECKNDDLDTVDEKRNDEPKNELEVPEETCCTICANEILNYEPEFFQDIEMNPACEECKFEDFRISKLPLNSPERKSSTWKSPAEAIAADSSVKANTFPPEQPFPPMTVFHQAKPFPPWQSSAPLSSTFPIVKPFPPF